MIDYNMAGGVSSVTRFSSFFQGDMSVFYVSDDKNIEKKLTSPYVPAQSDLQQPPNKERSTELILQGTIKASA